MSLIKKTALATAIAGSLMASSAAMAEFSMNVGATSNYIWRGMTQTSNGPAISGGVDYAHDSGFYIGTWASNIDWTGVPGYEIDGYLGYGMEFAKDWSFDVGYVYYAYPVASDETEADFGELYGSVAWTGLTLFGAVQTNSKYDFITDGTGYYDAGKDVNDKAYYVSLDYLLEYGTGWSSDFLIGYYAGDMIKEINNGKSYTHWYVDVTKSTDYGDVTLALSKANWDDSVANGFSAGEKDLNDPLVSVSWSKGF